MNLLEIHNSFAFINLLFITISITLIIIFSLLLLKRNEFLQNYSILFLTCNLFASSLFKLFFHDLIISAFNRIDMVLHYWIKCGII